MWLRRLIQLVALVMVGDGVIGFFKPRWHSLLWDIGPKPYRDAMRTLAAHAGEARWLYAAEVLVGTLLATSQTPDR